MNHDTDVLIIGGGVIGVCSAYYLTKQGCKVTLIEKGEICSGCSWGNMGLIVPSHSMPLAAPGVVGKALKWMLNPESPFYIKPRLDWNLIAWLWRFRRAANERRALSVGPFIRDLTRLSLELYDELDAIDGLEFDYGRRGVLLACLSRQAMDEFRPEADFLRKVGVEAREVNPQQMRELEPALDSSPIFGGIHYPEDASLTPARFVEGLSAHVQTMGATICPLTEVFDIDTSGGRITSIKTTRGEYKPDQVVLAAGSWTPILLKRLGINLPIQPAKGYSVTTTRPPGAPSMPLLLADAHMAASPMGDTMRFGGQLELAGMDFSINDRRVNVIFRGMKAFLPQLGDYEILRIWRGLRPCTPDGLPVIARSKAPNNLVVAAGHAMIGVSMGPGTGRLVAQIVAGEKPLLDLEYVALERF